MALSSSVSRTASRSTVRATVAAALAVAVLVGVGIGASSAQAADAPVELGTAASFGVLGGQTVTNTGPSLVRGNIGVAPGSAVTGFPPGITTGVFQQATAVATVAQTDLTAAYLDAEGRTPLAVGLTELGGMNLIPGVYSGGALTITGDLTLTGDASSVWIFQAGSSMVTGPGSRVLLSGPINPCNVFWQIDSTATLATGSTMVGTVMALTTINAQTNTTIDGRLLARNGEVTLDATTFIDSNSCVTAAGAGTPAPPATPVPGRATFAG
jgi:hypothetical protein